MIVLHSIAKLIFPGINNPNKACITDGYAAGSLIVRSPMIQNITTSDLETLKGIIIDCVRTDVAKDDSEADFLINDIVDSLDAWFGSDAEGYSAGYMDSNALVGFIIIKEYWNLSHLFVTPNHQHKGIGTALISSGIKHCQHLSPRNKIQLNSSSYASAFYESSGFIQTGPGIDRPGGCIPYEYIF